MTIGIYLDPPRPVGKSGHVNAAFLFCRLWGSWDLRGGGGAFNVSLAGDITVWLTATYLPEPFTLFTVSNSKVLAAEAETHSPFIQLRLEKTSQAAQFKGRFSFYFQIPYLNLTMLETCFFSVSLPLLEGREEGFQNGWRCLRSQSEPEHAFSSSDASKPRFVWLLLIQ